jgi:U3 small nucleolar RNA-associated protein MPP10
LSITALTPCPLVDILHYIEANYTDFFAPPTRVPAKLKSNKTANSGNNPSLGKVRFNEEVRVKQIKARGRNMPVSSIYAEDDDDDDEDDMEGAVDDDEDEDGVGDEAMSEEEEPDMDEEEGSEEESETEGLDTMDRLQNDLFADDDEPENDGTHVRHVLACFLYLQQISRHTKKDRLHFENK